MAERERQRIVIPPLVPGTQEYYSHQRQNRELLPIEKQLGMIRDPGYKYIYRSDDKKSMGISSILYLLVLMFLCLATSCVSLPKPEQPIVIELTFGNPESNITDSIDVELSGVSNDLPTDDIGDTAEKESLVSETNQQQETSIQEVQDQPIAQSTSENSFDKYLESISATSNTENISDTEHVSANTSETIQELSSSIGQAVFTNNSMASRYGSGDGMDVRLAKAGAQTGDVQYGNSSDSNFNLQRAGMGGSDLPDLKAEFNNIPHERGTLSMARSSDPDSANSQFFICFEAAPHLDRQYTVFGKVIEGMDNIDKIAKGDGPNGSVSNPDKIISFRSE